MALPASSLRARPPAGDALSELRVLRVSIADLTWADLAPIMRAEYDVPDKSYRQYELGQDVGRFLRAKRVEGSPATTLNSYEHTLRLLVLDHAELTLADFEGGGGADLLYVFLDRRWGDAAASTRLQRRGALASFFNWAEETDRITRNPARRLKVKRRSKRAVRRAHALAEIQRIASCQDTIAHEVFILVQGRLGLRKMEAGCLRASDVDLKRDVLYLEDTKAGEPAEQQIVYADVRRALDLWLREVGHPDERLIAPRGNPTRAPNQATVHRRFKECLERAGADDFPMHELRHSAGDFIHRQTGDTKAAQDVLRHSSLKVTEDYLHPTREHLRERMRQADASSEDE